MSHEALWVGRTVSWPDAEAMEDLAALRQAAPLIHCITNIVAAPITANILLAIGAAPAMVVAAEEAAPFAAIASALLINVGTITPLEEPAMQAAAAAAVRAGRPWVLDPVAVGALPLRTRVARDLLQHRPTIIRGNASEIIGLAGQGAGGRGVDATDPAETAIAAARELARQSGGIVAISGETDYVTDGDQVVAVQGGHIVMTKVTGIGCGLGAVLAAFAAVQRDRLRAAISASVVYGAAGGLGAQTSGLPGSFAVAFLDQLTSLEAV